MPGKRLAFYVDGFNLYFGLKAKGWKKYYWLNIEEMCKRLAKENQEVVKIRYFTARISDSNPEKRIRQSTYLEALETLPLVSIHYGTYLPNKITCFKCKNTFSRPIEKKSDVNLAVSMITDGIDDLYDTAVLISGDSDHTPQIEAIKKYFPDKRVLLYFPPKRWSASLKNVCHFFGGGLNKTTVSKSQFPDQVVNRNGYTLTRPESWR